MDILVVENEPLTSRVVEYLLKSEGYSVIRAENLCQAGSILESSNPKLVILDKDLGEGDGLQFCRDLEHTDPAARVIFITSETRPDGFLQNIKNASDYILKPFEPLEFVARVRAVLRNAA